MKQTNYAEALFNSGYNCAQAVSAAYADRLGIDEKLLLKTSAGFGGGIGRRQLTCGAVTGAIMVLGFKYGRSDDDEPVEMKDKMYVKTAEFIKRFEEKNGSITCLELLGGVKTSTLEGKSEFVEKGLHLSVCAPAVMSAIEILEEMMTED